MKKRAFQERFVPSGMSAHLLAIFGGGAVRQTALEMRARVLDVDRVTESLRRGLGRSPGQR